MVLSDFVASHLGQCTTDGDPYGCQCVALIYAYCDALGVQRLTGNAIDMAAQPNPGFAWIPMGSGPLGAGDVVVWGQTPTLGIGTLGHVDIAVDSITTSSYRGLDQNWYASDLNNGSPAAYVTHGYVGVLGWHHFQGGFSVTDSEAIQAVAAALLPAAGIQNLGFQITDTQNHLRNNVEPDVAALKQAVTDLQAQVAALQQSKPTGTVAVTGSLTLT